MEAFRPEIVEALGVARSVLDMGCGTGALAGALAGRAEVVGVEREAAPAREARLRCKRVHEIDLDVEDVPEPDGAFEALVYADVLEHLRDPWRALSRQRRLLAPGGRIVVSVPNAQHWRVSLGLLAGRWTYRDPDGLGHVLARDHLRFFTRHEAEEALRRAGYVAIASRAVASPAALALSPGPLRGLAAFQWVLTGLRTP